MNTKQVALAKKQHIALLSALTIEFILGVCLTTVVDYDPSKHSTVQTAVLVSHIVVAIGLLVGAGMRLLLAVRWQALRMPAVVGLLSILVGFASGGAAADSGAALAVLLMALFFMIAFVAYGYSFFMLRGEKS